MKNKFFTPIIILLFLALQVWCIYLIASYPFIGINLVNNSQSQWVIRDIDMNSAGNRLDIQAGDIVLQIDGNPPDIFPSVKWHTIEQARTLLLLRDGSEREVTVNQRNTPGYDISTILEELVCISMALLLTMKISESSSAKLLSAVFLCMAAIFMCLSASVRGDTIGKIGITSLTMVLPVVFYHFLVVFFREKGELELPVFFLKVGYGISALGFMIRLLYFFAPFAYTYFNLTVLLTLAFFIIGFLYNMYILTVLYFRLRKQQSNLCTIIKSVWLAFFISFLPVTCYSFLPQLLYGQWNIDARYTSWPILIFPISFAYLIASDQLYDIGLVLRRLAFAGLLSLAPVSLFTALYALLFKHSADGAQILFVLLGSLVLVTGMLYTAEYLTTRLEAFLFPRKHMLQTALKKIARNLGNISSFRELKEIILVDIVSTLQVHGGAIVFHYSESIEIIDEGDIDKHLVESLVRAGTILNYPGFTVVEMNRHEAYTSYLIMARKKTNTLLSKEEKQWLHLITSYLEVCLENVHLIRKLTVRMQQFASQLPREDAAQDIQWFRKIMFELQEEERVRIANDLHDTTMQDLFFLKRRVISIMEKYTIRPEDREQLEQLSHFVEMINAGLRQSCFELNPFLLHEVGLIQTLRMYLEKEAFTAPFELKLLAGPAPVMEAKELTVKRHLFRVVQELLNNAKKHSCATRVTFRITEDSRGFRLQYEDDGIGFTGQAVKREIGSSGLGLEQMRSRVLHMNGRVDCSTEPGKGTKWTIIIPVGEVISA